MTRESVPNSLRPPPGYEPPLTRTQSARLAFSDVRRRQERAGVNGRPLSPRSRLMQGQPCPTGHNSEYAYNDLGCRCEGCREAHRVARLERMHRGTA